jgi:hyperosmotically inducible periplasmic protein
VAQSSERPRVNQNEVVIKDTGTLIFAASALFLTMTTVLAACVGQRDPGSAEDSMHEAAESANSAAANTGQVFVHAYNGAATAVTDSATTAKVKTALVDDKLTTDSDIHVSTVAGVVILEGNAASPGAANRAEELSQGTVGVRSVRDKLTIPSPAN